jgi:hypothetical protein
MLSFSTYLQFKKYFIFPYNNLKYMQTLDYSITEPQVSTLNFNSFHLMANLFHLTLYHSLTKILF